MGKVLATAILISAALAAARADGPLTVTDPGLVKKLSALQNSIDKISHAVTNCVEAGRPHPECMCQSDSAIEAFRTQFEAVTTSHPELLEVGAVNFRRADGMSIAQNFKGIKKQLAHRPAC